MDSEETGQSEASTATTSAPETEAAAESQTAETQEQSAPADEAKRHPRSTERSQGYREMRTMLERQQETNRIMAEQMELMRESMELQRRGPAPDPRKERREKLRDAASKITADPSTQDKFFDEVIGVAEETARERAEEMRRQALVDATKISRAHAPRQVPPDLAAVEREFPWLQENKGAIDGAMELLLRKKQLDYDSMDRRERIALLREAASKVGRDYDLPRMSSGNPPRGSVGGGGGAGQMSGGGSDDAPVPPPTPLMMTLAEQWRRHQPNNKRLHSMTPEQLHRAHVAHLRKGG